MMITEARMPQPHDPYKTQPLLPLAAIVARPVALPLAAIVALAVVPVLLITTLLLLWGGPRPAGTPATALLPSPTLGIARVALAVGLPRAVVAYDAPDGRVVGALEPGRTYRVTARSRLAWLQLDVAPPGAPANLVWVAAHELPELGLTAGLADLAPPAPTPAPQIVYVAVPGPAAPPAPAPADAPALPEPTRAPTTTYLIPPATPAPRSVVVRPFPTAPPCRLRELGSTLRICNGLTP